MKISRLARKGLDLIALGCAVAAPVGAPAQSIPANRFSLSVPETTFRLSFDSGDRQTWHDLELVSAAVAIVGIVENDSALTVLGAVGLLFCFVEADQSHSRFTSHGLDLVRTGGFSAGITPFGMTDLRQGLRPAGFLQFGFRF